jgi:RNA polymerase sigma-B factor
MHVSRLLSRTLTWLRQAMLTDTPPRWESGGGQLDGQGLRLSVRRCGEYPSGWVVVAVGGEVDRDTADQLREVVVDTVTAARSADVIIDLEGVPFIDAAGIAALLASHEAARRCTTRLRVAKAQPYVRRSLTVAGLAPLLE